MNFFGGTTCGGVEKDTCNTGFDCCSIIFLLLFMQNCGGMFKGGINIDCNTILLLLILSNCGCGKSY